MANTYTQIYIHIIFSVLGKQNLIAPNHREEIEKYICEIISNKKSKPLAIYCNPDHTHVFTGLHPDISVSEITRFIKANSSKFINEKNWIYGNFNWQDGFGAFSYAKSQIHQVSNYILNQPNHHKKQTFREEYLEFLKRFEIKYNEKYLFEWYD